MDKITRKTAEPYVALAPRSQKRFICTICNGYSVRTKDKYLLLDHIVKHLRYLYFKRPILPKPANMESKSEQPNTQ